MKSPERTNDNPGQQRLSELDDRTGDITLQYLVATLWRRKWVLVATVAVLVSVLAVYLLLAPNRYTARAHLMLGSPAAEVVDFKVVPGIPARDEALVNNELQVLRSRELAWRVIERLQLDQQPEFSLQTAEGEATLDESLRRTRLVEAFLGRLDVGSLRESRIARIEFTAADPALAAQVANTLAELYLFEQREAKLDTTEKTVELLQQRVDAAEISVREAERAVEEFQRRHRLLTDAEGESLRAQDLAEVSASLREAETTRLEAEARLGQFQGRPAADINLGALAAVADTTTLDRLQQQEQTLEREIAELAARYSERNLRLVAARRDLAAVRGRIERELRQLVDGLALQAELARAHESSLRERLQRLEEELAQAEISQVELRALEREADSSRTLLAALRERLKQASALQDIEMQQADARIVSRANVPAKPSAPRVLPLLAAGVLGAGFLGVLLIFLLEHLQPLLRRSPDLAPAASGFRSAIDVEAATGLPVIARVPMLQPGKQYSSPSSYFLRAPRSPFAEAQRRLYNTYLGPRRLRAGDPLAETRKVLVTSAHNGEGRTTTALCLARAGAQAGHKVVLLDADLRKPGLHRCLGMPPQQGLTEVLLDKALPEHVVRRDPLSKLDVVLAGENAVSPPELLSSRAMNDMLAYLQQNYELVVIDSSALMSAPDARILARNSDLNVFVIRWDSTDRESVANALKWIRPAEAEIVGVAMTMVEARRFAGAENSTETVYNRSLA